jgi:hypothetical protein
LVSGYYAFERRKTPVQKDETATAPLRPVELQSSLINLPAHHWTSVPLSLPYSGILDIKVRVVRGNPVNVALIHADQLPGIEHAKQLIPPAELMKASLGGYRAPSVRSYSHYQAMEAGEYLLIVQDTTLGILAVSSGSIEIRAELWPTDVK